MTRRVDEAGTSAERLPLAATATTVALAPGLGTSDSLFPNAIAVDARIKLTGDLGFFQGRVACMAAEPKSCFPIEAAARVVSAARRLRRDMPADYLSVNEAWLVMADDSWEVQQRQGHTRALVSSL